MRSQVQTLLSRALATFGDAREDVTYQGSGGTYDPLTETTMEAPGALSLENVLFTDFRVDQIDNVTVLSKDKQVIVAGLGLDPSVFVIEGTFTRSNGEVWRIINLRLDPAGAIFLLHVRQA